MQNSKRVTFEYDDPGELARPLHDACTDGTIEDIRNFFNKDTKLEDLYYEGLSPLHRVVISGRDDINAAIDVLIKNGVDVNGQTESSKDTALHLAVENGDFPRNYDVIVKLVDLKADPDIRNKRLRTPYDCALAKGHDLIAATLDGSKSTTEVQNTYRERYGRKYAPALNKAVLESNEEGIQLCIKKGGDPNYINKFGAGAIHYAVTRCTLPVLHVLDMLLSAGADVDLTDDEGDTALNLAIKTDDLRRKGELLPVVKLLVDAGADVTLRDLDGNDAVRLAEEKGYRDVLNVLNGKKSEQLREREVEPEMEPTETEADKPEQEPEPEHEPEPEPELEADANENKEEQPESTDDHTGIAEDEQEKEETPESEEENIIMDSLEDTRTNEGDHNRPNEDGLYPIHQAVLKEDPEERQRLLDTLVEAGADVNVAVRGVKTTALHFAADRGYADTVKFLLEHGADKTKTTVLKKTPFDMASDKDHQEVMELLGDRHDLAQDKWKKGKKKTSTCLIL